MKKLHLILILVLLAFGFSCKKNNDTQIQTNYDSPRIKRMMLTDTTGKYISLETFQYDAQGRVVQGMLDFPPYYDSTIYKYEYYQDSVVEKIFYADYSKMGRLVFYLNSDGLATLEEDYLFNYEHDSLVYQTRSYKYNADGYMIEKRFLPEVDPSKWLLTKWQISDGNISTITNSAYYWGSGTVTQVYEYLPNSINTIGYLNQGNSYFGKSSHSLAKSFFQIDFIPRSMTYSFTYSFDSVNRVIEIRTRIDNSTVGGTNMSIEYY